MQTQTKFPFKLFFSLILLNFIPNLYETIKIFFVNTSATSLSVVSQIEWFDLINEVLITFLTVPLYSLLNKEVCSEQFKKKSFQAFSLTCILYWLFSIVVYSFTRSMVSFMTGTTHQETIRYLQLETIAFAIGIIPTFFLIIFTIVRRHVLINILLFSKMFAIVIGDFLLINKYGSFGISYANMLTNVLLSIVCICIAIRSKLLELDFHISRSFIKEWLQVGIFVGMQIFLDNWIYAVMVCKMVNAVSEQGNYWIANNFIWNWLLVPCIALSEIIKTDCKNGVIDLPMKRYGKIVGCITGIWFLTIPTWPFLFKYLMQVENAKTIMHIVLMLVPFYATYMISQIFDSIFYGIGETKYNCLISIFVNIIYYGIVYLLFKQHIFTMNITFIVLMFGIGMFVHAILSYIFFIHLRKH